MPLCAAGEPTMLNEAYIGLGSNLGKSVQNLRSALDMIGQFGVDLQASSLYRTAPQGFRSQPPFYNAACRLRTRLTSFQLMDELLGIEAAVGRRRTFRNAPRLLDLDILLYNRLVIHTPPVMLPHPQLSARSFVLRPLADIAPHLRHPVNGLTVSDMLEELPLDSDGITAVSWR